jgi:hypothetical protein
MSKADGDPVYAKELFSHEIDDFRRYVPVKTVCMHGAPLSFTFRTPPKKSRIISTPLYKSLNIYLRT